MKPGIQMPQIPVARSTRSSRPGYPKSSWVP